MAYGVGNPADDWTKVNIGVTVTPNKVTHASLGSNVLVNHGAYCSRLGYVSGDATAKGCWWTYTNAAYNNALFHSTRMLFRPGQIGSGCPLFPPFAWVQHNAATDNRANYCIVAWSKDSVNAHLILGHKDLTTSGYALDTEVVRSANLSQVWAANDWFGMRIDCVRQGNDMQIAAYVVMGAAACDTLDANGEPDWVKVIDVSHINGTVVPVVNQGTFLNNWYYLFTTPIYAGVSGWGLSTATTTQHTWVDSVRIKQLT